MTPAPVRLAIMGTGLIGRRHAEHVAREADLAAVVDPSPSARAVAEAHGAPWFASLDDLLAVDRPDGVIVATPNQLHVENGLACVGAGLPALIEKPIADAVADAESLVAAAEAAGVPLLVGHHRRYNPLIRRAREMIAAGELGAVIAVQATCWFAKPDSYFEPEWRRTAGAGPIFVNLIHDIDLLRFLCGEIESVRALQSNAVRGHAVEESAAILLRFASGALGTVSVSDTIAGPWNWEMTAGENPAYPRTSEACYMIGGTRGSLSLPDLGLWSHQGDPDWWTPISRQSSPVDTADPLALQIRHFAAVIRGEAEPLVSGREGLETLRVIEAVKRSAGSGEEVRLP
jgi:predicted dehydrogenase